MTQSVSFQFHCDGLPEDTFSVASFAGEEGISRLYRFGIDLVSENADLDIDDIQNRSGRLVIKAGGRERVIQGIVIRTDIVDHAEGHAVYRVKLVPRVWSLTRSSGNAVYLHRSTPEILRGVLEDRLGITGIDRDDRFATDDYPRRPFQLQYGETDWAFLSALMEHDGIYYFFRPGDDTEHIVFCDYSGGQPEPEDTAIEYNAELGLHTTEVDGTVHNLLARHEHLPEAVEVRNYDDERPSVPIHARAEVDPRGSGTVHFYGQNTRDPEEAQAIADIRAEELACMKAVYHGESTAFHLAAGHRFRLAGHPRERCNGTFQVLSVEHSGHDPEVCGRIGRDSEGTTPVYDNRFTALPGDVQFRPPRKTERPRIQGTLNAHIDAEGDGVFAEPDGEGRYHVVFPFHPGFHDSDTRDDAGKASHWLRLLQPYGGKAEGMHFPLRKGTRVLVGFVGGNPDLPVINGTIPNAEQPSVLQDRNLNKGTIRTPGGNLIETDDEKPRVKLYSPMKNTYMHLGSSNAPGDGIVTATEGLALFTALGGSSVHYATNAWVVDSDVWPLLTGDARDAELGAYTLEGVSNHEVESEWRLQDAIEKIFAFPKKHTKPAQGDPEYRPIHDALSDNGETTLTSEDELSNLFHTSRTVGDRYTYRSGTDFSFEGPQRESFDFGPMASYTSWSHDEDPDELRNTVTTVMKEFGGDAPTSVNYTDEQDEYNVAFDKRVRTEALLILLQEHGDTTDTDIRKTQPQKVLGGSSGTLPAGNVETENGHNVVSDAGINIIVDDNGTVMTETGHHLIIDDGGQVTTDLQRPVYADVTGSDGTTQRKRVVQSQDALSYRTTVTEMVQVLENDGTHTALDPNSDNNPSGRAVTENGNDVVTVDGDAVIVDDAGNISTEDGKTVIQDGKIQIDMEAKRDGSTASEPVEKENDSLFIRYEITASDQLRVTTASGNEETISIREEPSATSETFRSAVDRIANTIEVTRTGILDPDSSGAITIPDPADPSKEKSYNLESKYKTAVYDALKDHADKSNLPNGYTASELLDEKWTRDDYRIRYRAAIADHLNLLTEDDKPFADWFEDVPSTWPNGTSKLDLSSEKSKANSGFKDYLEKSIIAYGEKRLDYSIAWKNALKDWDDSADTRILNGRMSVNNVDTLSISRGTSYSFTLGASYSETHVADVDNIISGSNSKKKNSNTTLDSTFSGTVNQSYDEDLTDNDGPKFSKVNADVGDNWDAGEVTVSKMIGNTYNYHKGDSASVHIGDVHQITKYGHIKEDQKHPRSGDTISYREGSFGAEGHEAGWHEFQATYIPKIALSINMALRQDITINALGCTNNTVNAGLVATNTVNTLGAATTTFNLGLCADINLSAGGILSISHAVGGIASYGNGTFESNLAPLRSEIDLAKTRISSSMNDLNNYKIKMGKRLTTINESIGDLQRSTVNLYSRVISIQRQTGVCIYN